MSAGTVLRMGYDVMIHDDSHLTRGAVDEVVASTAAEVRVHVFNIFP